MRTGRAAFGNDPPLELAPPDRSGPSLCLTCNPSTDTGAYADSARPWAAASPPSATQLFPPRALVDWGFEPRRRFDRNCNRRDEIGKLGGALDQSAKQFFSTAAGFRTSREERPNECHPVAASSLQWRSTTTAAVPASGDEPYLIGLIAGTTGAYGSTGVATVNGAEMAVDKINAAGGVLGRRSSSIGTMTMPLRPSRASCSRSL